MELQRFKPVVGFSTYNAPPMPESYRDKIEKSLQSDMEKIEYDPLDLIDAVDDRQIFRFAHDGSGNWGRAFRQFNFIEGLYRITMMEKFDDVEGFDPLQHPSMEEIPDMQKYRFLNAGSEGELLQKIELWKNDTEDMEMLMSSNSMYPILGASIFSPTSLAPLAPIKYWKASSVWKRFGGGAAFTAAIVAPEELLMAETIQSRDIGHATISIAAAGLIGGTLTSIFGGNKGNLILSGANSSDAPMYKSAGASANPELARETARRTMDGDALAETGVKIEKLGWNPVNRLLKSNNYLARQIATQLVDIGGMIQKKIRKGEAQTQSVETNFRARWIPGLLSSIRQIDEAYLAYRNIIAKEGDIGRSLQLLKTSVTDTIQGSRRKFMTHAEFRVRVAQAMRRGDKDPVNDSATDFVNKAASSTRKHFDDIKNEATNVQLFEKQAGAIIKKLKNQIDETTDPVQKQKLQETLVQAQAYLKQLRENGVNVNTAISYLPRIIRVDKVIANKDQWLKITYNYAKNELGLDEAAAKKFADSSYDRAIHGKPWFDVENANELDFITQASGTKARTFGIKDELIEEFTENDIEVLLRHHTKTMGTDIELTRAFGDVSLQKVIDDIIEEYQELVKAGREPEPVDMSKATTGKSIFISAWRGSEGGGKVGFKKSALGEGLYFAINKGTAKLFGKTVKNVKVFLKNPFVIKSDDGLLNAMRSFGIDVSKISFREEFGVDNLATQISKKMAKIDEMKKKAMKDKKPPSAFAKEVAPIQDEIADLLKIYNKEVDRIWSEFNDAVRQAGYDGMVFSFGKRNYTQATYGKLTFSKVMKEWQEAQSSGNPLLVRRLNHDQAIRFNKDAPLNQGVPKQQSAQLTRELNEQMKADIRDVKGLRDRIRGTYGASKDPHQMSSRFVRAMKSFNVLVGMGSATLSSVPDIARTVMTEGMLKFYEKGLRNLFKNNQSLIKKMTLKELRQAGVAADAVLGLRASAFSDVGDLFGSRMGFERTLNKTTAMFFLANGLNYWNQAMKSFAGGVTMLRMTESIMKPWKSLSRTEKEKLLKNGIDEQMVGRMEIQIKQHGEQVDGEWMPNTESWSDRTAAQTFRNALNQSVERTIVTPGAGDRALWTSTEFGSLLTQFKGYGQGATVRILTSGLQEKDQAFWQGAFLMVGLAYFVNEAKKKQYGIEKEDSFMEGLINAIDRSGTLGWFTDVNNGLEKISDYKLGLRSVFGDERHTKLPFSQKVGAFAGPAANNLGTLGGFATDVLSGDVDERSLKSLRFVQPGGNLPYLDPIFDGIYGQ